MENKKKSVFISVFLSLILLMNFASAVIVINEVELNPFGNPDLDEWVEIYSDEEVDLSGWYIIDKSGDKTFFINETLNPLVSRFYVLEEFDSNELVNGGENISLVNSGDAVIDSVLNLDDGDNDDSTWSRLPDVTGNFTFQEETKGAPNEPFVIEDKSSSPSCLVKGDSVELSVQVTGFCLEDVKFSIFTFDEGWKNFSASFVSGNNYSVVIDSADLWINNTVVWTVHASSCFESKTNGNETFYLNNQTSLSIDPSAPNGLNNFYISEPLISLDNGDADDTFYRWDGDANNDYSSPFGLEDTPNNWEVTGGILELHYFSNFSSCSEEEKDFSFLADFQDPVVTNIFPNNNSVINTDTPEISARLEELYGDNSGIDESSVIFMVDGVTEIPAIVPDGLDATLSFTPAPLSEGYHNVSIFVKDEAGRESLMNWAFNVSFVSSLTFNNVSLNDGDVFDARRVPIIINLSGDAESLEYKNSADTNSRFRRLCRNCDSYGIEREKSLSLREGENNIMFRASRNGEVVEENVSVFVDSKSPRISRILPRRNSYTNGSDFYVRYTEDNLENISLVINSENVSFIPNQQEFIGNCTSGKNQECFFNVDISAFNNESINFSFLLNDPVHNVSSRSTASVFVDTASPMMELNMPVNGSLVSRAVAFNLSVSEDVDLEYMDLSNPRPKFKRLCNNCNSYGDNKESTKRFTAGEHMVLIRAVDKAGNSDEEIVSFSVL